ARPRRRVAARRRKSTPEKSGRGTIKSRRGARQTRVPARLLREPQPPSSDVEETEAESPAADAEVELAPEEGVEHGAAIGAAAAVEDSRPGDDEDEEPEASDGRAVVPFDPLQRYLTEIRRYPLLTREEEKDLAIRYREHEDIDAAYKLVTGNLRLVVMIAREYQRATRNLLDLIQEGNIGLMEAVKKFDPYRGIRFPSYAVWWVRAYIIRYLINNWRVVKLGTTQA